MKTRVALSCLAVSAWMGWLATATDAAETPNSPERPRIYDTQADGEKQIAEALKTARREHKHVLLQFGANWCGWCHKLHGLFKSNATIAAHLRANYVVVLIDVDQVEGKPHNAATVTRYGTPTRFGLPAIVVLDWEGKPLTTQDTGQLEEGDHHNPAKVLAFLQKWAPEQQK